MFGMGHWEILIILLVILLIFGAKRIPEMAQGLGKGIREFRKAVHEVQDEIDTDKPTSPTAHQITGPEGASGQAGSAGSGQTDESVKTPASTSPPSA